MIPYSRQYLDKQDMASVNQVLKSDWLTQGPKVLEFERTLAQYCGAKYAVAVSSGTAALHLAYLSLDVKKGDEVIVPANTFAATANMVLACGGKPIFCDIRLDTYNIDETKISRLINKRTKAIVVVHFAGQPANLGAIWRLAEQRGIKVIEDGAHALGAKYQNRLIGGGRSTLVTFSFHPVKSITTGEGGAILTNNKGYYNKLIKLRSHGISKNAQGLNIMDQLGFNYRLTDIQAILGLSQLKKLDKFMTARRRVAEWHYHNLRNIPQLILPTQMPEARSAWHLFVIRVNNKEDRLPLRNFLHRHGIATQIHYPPVYSHPYYRRHGYRYVNCRNAEDYGQTCLSIPIFPALTKRQSGYIANCIKAYYQRH